MTVFPRLAEASNCSRRLVSRQTLRAVTHLFQPDSQFLEEDIRNAYSFHLPEHAQLDNAYGKLPVDVDLHVYSGAERHSSLNEMSHTLMLCGMLELVPGSASMTDNAAMDAIVTDVLAKSVDLNDLIEQVIIVLVEQHNLSPGPMKEVATIDGSQSMKTFMIPPLLRN